MSLDIGAPPPQQALDDLEQWRKSLRQSPEVFALKEMALNVRSWLEWTENVAKNEGHPVGDLQFRTRPSYQQFVAWERSLHEAATALEAAQREIARLRGIVAADMLETGSCGSGMDDQLGQETKT